MGYGTRTIDAQRLLNTRINCHTATFAKSIGKMTFHGLLDSLGITYDACEVEERDDGKGYIVSDGRYPPTFAEFKVIASW